MRGLLLACLIGLAPGCTQFGTSDPLVEHSLEGDYDLVGLNGAPVPVDQAELPKSPIDGSPSGCYFTLTEGQLELGPPGRTYRLRIVHRHSCQGHILSDQSTVGTYERDGAGLVLTYHGHTLDFLYHATIDGTRVTLDKEGKTYHFERTSAQ